MVPTSVHGNNHFVPGLLALGIVICGLLFVSFRMRKNAELTYLQKEYSLLLNNQEEANRNAINGIRAEK